MKQNPGMNVDALKSKPLLLYIHFCQSETKNPSLTRRAEHVDDMVTQSSLQEFKAS